MISNTINFVLRLISHVLCLISPLYSIHENFPRTCCSIVINSAFNVYPLVQVVVFFYLFTINLVIFCGNDFTFFFSLGLINSFKPSGIPPTLTGAIP